MKPLKQFSVEAPYLCKLSNGNVGLPLHIVINVIKRLYNLLGGLINSALERHCVESRQSGTSADTYDYKRFECIAVYCSSCTYSFCILPESQYYWTVRCT